MPALQKNTSRAQTGAAHFLLLARRARLTLPAATYGAIAKSIPPLIPFPFLRRPYVKDSILNVPTRATPTSWHLGEEWTKTTTVSAATKPVSARMVASKAQADRRAGQGVAAKLRHPEGLDPWRGGGRAGEKGDGGTRLQTRWCGWPGSNARDPTTTSIVSGG